MQGDLLTIQGSDYNHIKNVMRLKPGDRLSVSNGTEPYEYICSINGFSEKEVFCRIEEKRERDTELPVRVTLYQGLPKSDKMELIIQKTVELGVSRIIPVEMERCVMKLEGGKKDKKTARWQTIAEAAAKQSQRNVIPEVLPPMKMKEALSFAKNEEDRILIPYEKCPADQSTSRILRGLETGMRIGVFIGPEGGFDEKEILMSRESGASVISLGRRILRTETAGPAILAWLTYLFEMEQEAVVF